MHVHSHTFITHSLHTCKYMHVHSRTFITHTLYIHVHICMFIQRGSYAMFVPASTHTCVHARAYSRNAYTHSCMHILTHNLIHTYIIHIHARVYLCAIYIHTYIHTYIHIHARIYSRSNLASRTTSCLSLFVLMFSKICTRFKATCMPVGLCMALRGRKHTYVYVFVCICICVFVCVFVFVYVYACVHVCVCVFVYMYTYTNVCTSPILCLHVLSFPLSLSLSLSLSVPPSLPLLFSPPLYFCMYVRHIHTHKTRTHTLEFQGILRRMHAEAHERILCVYTHTGAWVPAFFPRFWQTMHSQTTHRDLKTHVHSLCLSHTYRQSRSLNKHRVKLDQICTHEYRSCMPGSEAACPTVRAGTKHIPHDNTTSLSSGGPGHRTRKDLDILSNSLVSICADAQNAMKNEADLWTVANFPAPIVSIVL